MKPAMDLKRKCEAWWEKLAQANPEQHAQFAEEFLEWFGWIDPTPVACPGGVGGTAAVSYLLQQGAQGVMAAHFVLPGILKSPSAYTSRSLDFCEATRVLVSASFAMNARYAFISDMYRAWLYDTTSDELLLAADSPAEIDSEFNDILDRSRVQEGILDQVRRNPRSAAARQLRDWTQRWAATLSSEWHMPEDLAWLTMDRLILIRYMTETNALRRPGWQLRTCFVDLLTKAASRSSSGIGNGLINLFHILCDEWNLAICSHEPIIESVIANDQAAIPLLAELCMLSRTKFQTDAILESFNHGDAAEKARVRMIPEDDPDRSAYIARQTHENVDNIVLHIDLDAEGYRAIFHWFNKLMNLYQRLEDEYAQAQKIPGATDLFEWSENHANTPKAFHDRFQQAIEKGLVLYYSSPRQYRTARLMLYLHLIEQYRRHRTRIVRLPNIEIALAKRPSMLESDWRQICQNQPNDEWEAM